MIPSIAEIWESVREQPLPEVPPEVNDAIDVELLDTTTRDAIQSYLLAGSINGVTNGHLRACLQQLKEIIPSLSGDAARYFGALRDVAELIVGTRARPGLPPGLMG